MARWATFKDRETGEEEWAVIGSPLEVKPGAVQVRAKNGKTRTVQVARVSSVWKDRETGEDRVWGFLAPEGDEPSEPALEPEPAESGMSGSIVLLRPREAPDEVKLVAKTMASMLWDEWMAGRTVTLPDLFDAFGDLESGLRLRAFALLRIKLADGNVEPARDVRRFVRGRTA